MGRLVAIFPLLGLIPSLAIAEFTFPPKFGNIGEYISDLNFTVGQPLNFTWEISSSSSNQLSLWLMQDVDTQFGDCAFQSSAQCRRIAVTPNNGSFPWTVSRMGMTNGDFYYVSAFGIANPTNSALDKHFNAHYINITDHPNSPSSTTVTPSSTSASSSGSMTAQASATSATLSPLPSSSSSSSNKLPLAVGLGVGLPLGLMAVVGLIWLVQRHRRKSIPVLVGQEEAGGSQVYPKSELDSETAFYYQTEGVTEYHEVEGTPPERVWPQELDARGE